MDGLNTTAMTQILKRFYPKGKIWDATLSGDTSIEVRAEMFAEAYAFLGNVLAEMDIRTAKLILKEYAEEYGVDIGGLSVAEAQALILLKKNARGGQSVPYFKNLISSYGAKGKIEECAPLVCGLSEAGGTDQCGDEDTVYMWFIEIDEVFGGVEILEKALKKYAPAHTNLTVIKK